MLTLLSQEGAGLYSDSALGGRLAAAVDQLCASSACPRPAPESLAAGQGTWEVRCLWGDTPVGAMQVHLN